MSVFQHRLEADNSSSKQPCQAESYGCKTRQSTNKEHEDTSHLNYTQPTLPNFQQEQVGGKQVSLDTIYQEVQCNMDPQNGKHPGIEACDTLGLRTEGNRSREDVGSSQPPLGQGGQDRNDRYGCDQHNCRPLHSVSPSRWFRSTLEKPLLMSQSGPG